MSNDYRAAIRDGLAALASRDMPRAAALLREAAGSAAPGTMPWIALANAEMALGDNDAAEAAVDRQLSLAPREVGALLLKGLLRERGGDARGAVSFYRMALAQAAADGAVPPALTALRDHAEAFSRSADGDFAAHLIEQLGTGLSPSMAEAIDLLTGKRALFLQQPSMFYFPGLPQRRFFEAEEFPWFTPMLALLPQMQAELAAMSAVQADSFRPYIQPAANRPLSTNPLLGDPAWSALYFWRDGAQVDVNASLCPATMEALSHAPMPQIPGRAPNAHWSRLKPGAHIAPHSGMLNTRLICHIPIRTAPACTLRVGNETREWIDGVPLIFDDSIEHEARNAGPDERVVLLFEIWRPEIAEEDRAAITRVFEAIASYE